MPILIALGVALLVFCIFMPQWWVRRTLTRNQEERADFPGTGAELAANTSLFDSFIGSDAAGSSE